MPKNVTTWFIDDPQWDKKRHPMVVFTICLFFTPTQKKYYSNVRKFIIWQIPIYEFFHIVQNIDCCNFIKVCVTTKTNSNIMTPQFFVQRVPGMGQLHNYILTPYIIQLLIYKYITDRENITRRKMMSSKIMNFHGF